MTTTRQKAGWLAIAVTCVSGFEGLRQIAYRDPVGIPTACFGETKGIKMGDKFTLAQCQGMLADSLQVANKAVDSCVHAPLPDERRAALVSFTYNIGGGAFCSSTLVKVLNSGQTKAACDQLLRWDTAKGIKLPGLTKRRQAERELCMKGLS